MSSDYWLDEIYKKRDRADEELLDILARVRAECPGIDERVQWRMEDEAYFQRVNRRWNIAKYIGAAAIFLGVATGPIVSKPVTAPVTPCADIYPCAGLYQTPCSDIYPCPSNEPLHHQEMDRILNEYKSLPEIPPPMP
jgi:hypothetical protein